MKIITARVHLNKAMETSVPLRVTFGSSLPYAERLIEGEYISEYIWEGKYQLTTIIEMVINSLLYKMDMQKRISGLAYNRIMLDLDLK